MNGRVPETPWIKDLRIEESRERPEEGDAAIMKEHHHVGDGAEQVEIVRHYEPKSASTPS